MEIRPEINVVIPASRDVVTIVITRDSAMDNSTISAILRGLATQISTEGETSEQPTETADPDNSAGS